MFQKFPKSFLLLANVELWERFSFYSMSYLIPLYLSAKVAHGGLGWTDAAALRFSGIYAFASWCTPILGGYVADKFMGPRKALYLGALLMVLGHFLILFSQFLPLFFLAISFISLGCGFFKPAITGMVGECFKGKGSSNSDNAFAFYYLAVNLGILFAGLSSGAVSEKFGYNPAFSLAAIGMSFGLLMLFFYKNKIKNIGNLVKEPHLKIIKNNRKKNLSTSLLLRKKRFVVVLYSYFVSFFWFFVYFFGVGGALSLYIRDHTDRNFLGFVIPITWFPSLSPLFLIIGTFVMYKIWNYFKITRSKEVHTVTKICLGMVSSTLAFLILYYLEIETKLFPGQPISLFFIVLFYLFCVIGELNICPTTYSLISQVVEQKNVSFYQAITFSCYGLGGLSAGYLGSIAFRQGQGNIFFAIAVLLVAISLLSLFFRKKMIQFTKS
ncbi:MAG: oligopeptide:H+ symporter [Silvanigrellaceae bacterium]|nr:oligopeptide:H+ symporter [Silvanigrellaceae bacterium]